MSAGRRGSRARLLRGRAGRFQLALRGAIAAGGALAVGCTRVAGHGSMVAVELAIIGVALLCAIVPDTHLGLVVIGAVAVTWVVTVDDVTTPWAIGAAISLALFHTCAAAASVAPIGASWTFAMARRWSGRFGLVAATSVPTWTAAALLDRADIGASPALVTAALLLVACGGLWARHGSLGAAARTSH